MLQSTPMTQGLPSHKQHSDPHEVCHCVQLHHRANTAPDSVQASSSMIPVMQNQQKCNLTSVKVQQMLSSSTVMRRLTFRHRVSCIMGQAFRYSPENASYIFNQQIYFIM